MDRRKFLKTTIGTASVASLVPVSLSGSETQGGKVAPHHVFTLPGEGPTPGWLYLDPLAADGYPYKIPVIQSGRRVYERALADPNHRWHELARKFQQPKLHFMDHVMHVSKDGLSWETRMDYDWGQGRFSPEEPHFMFFNHLTGKHTLTVRPGLGDRCVAITMTDDFKSWSEPRVVLQPDLLDRKILEFYAMPVFPYGTHFVGFVWASHFATSEGPDFMVLHKGPQNPQLVYSSDGAHYPETQGFDVGIGGTHWGCPATFFYPFRGMLYGDYRYVPGLGFGKDGDYLTDRLTDEAIKVIDDAKGRPFFLYLAYYTVHFPIEGKEELVGRYQKKVKPGMRHTNATYAAMVHSLDESVGRILGCLEKHGIADRTIVILTSDNGGFTGKWKEQPVVTNNAPLRSGKGSLYEGGVRVPLIIRWPGTTKPGTTCTTPAILTDSYRTIMEMAGLDEPVSEGKICDDGVSLVPLLEDPIGKLDREALYWHYPHYYPTTTPVSAIRSGDWKLLEYLEDGRVELYNLRDDLGEQKNLAPEMPDRRNGLLERLHDWREQVNAQMPEPNSEGQN